MSNGQAVKPGVGGNLKTKPFEIGFGISPDFSALDEPQEIFRFTPKKNIGGHIEIFEDVKFLMNESDAQLDGIGDIIDADRLAVPKNFPAVGLIHAAEDLHESGFACAVLTANRDDFAFSNGETDIIKRDDP